MDHTRPRRESNGNTAGAKTAVDHVLADEPENVAALIERADLFTDEKNFELAIADLKTAARLKSNDKAVMSRLAYALQQAGKTEEAQAVAKSAGIETQLPAGNSATGVVGTPEEIEAANNSDPVIARKALEKLLRRSAQRDAARSSRSFVPHRRSRSVTRVLSQSIRDSA